jgi:hypothetical protein
MIIRDRGTLALAIIFVSLTAGLCGATRELGQFSPVPQGVLIALVGLAGLALGSLVYSFTQLLIAILLAVLLSGGVMVVALLISEWGDGLLGLEATLSLAVNKAVLNSFALIFPVTLLGGMVGRLLYRE